MIETDCEVDFAPPLDYVEPTRDEYAASAAAAAGAAAAAPPEASASAPSGEVAPFCCWLKHVSAQAVCGSVACPPGLAAAASAAATCVTDMLPPQGRSTFGCKVVAEPAFLMQLYIVLQAGDAVSLWLTATATRACHLMADTRTLFGD